MFPGSARHLLARQKDLLASNTNDSARERCPTQPADDKGMGEYDAEAAHVWNAEVASHSGVAASSKSSGSSLDVKKDVFLNFEVLKGHQHKLAQVLWSFNLASALTWYGLSQWLLSPNRAADRDLSNKATGNRVTEETLNAIQNSLQEQFQLRLYLSVGVYCLALCLPMFVWATRRIVKTRNFSWTRRQRYLVTVSYLKLGIQTVIVIFLIAPNAFALYSCRYFAAFVKASAYIRWTCWNTLMCLTNIHARNCCPALIRKGRNKDKVPRIGDPRYKYDGNDVMVLDGVFVREHWYFLVFWCFAEASIIYLAASGGVTFVKPEAYSQPAPSFCPDTELPLVEGLRSRIVFWIIAAWMTMYVACASFLARWSSLHLRGQSYNVYQFANLLMMWLRQQSVWMDIVAIADVSLLYGGGTILSYLLRFFGQPSLTVLSTAITIQEAFYMLPSEPSNEEHVYNAWLQQFVWTKQQEQPRMRAILKQSPTMAGVLGSQPPIFCMETALKLLVWSTVVYEDATVQEGMPELKGRSELTAVNAMNDAQKDSRGDLKVKWAHDRGQQEEMRPALSTDMAERQASEDSNSVHESILASRPDMDGLQPSSEEPSSSFADSSKDEGTSTAKSKVEALTTEQYLSMAMDMYHLTDMKIIHGPVTDTKAIIAWNGHTVVLAFRGTSSFANVRIDAKLWRSYHEPKRGNYWLGTAPMVHKGFQLAWDEVKDRVMEEMAALVKRIHVPNHLLQVYLTGHSLGGALATLAAWDIQTKYRFPELTCYTYGSPRTGNKALADEFQGLVPNLYHVINDRDAVPRGGKFFMMYKRPGQRVLINARGDIRVRPTIFEITLHTKGFSVRQHLLKAYLDSLSAICVAQFFTTKASKGGLKGVAKLAESEEICCLLQSCGIDLRQCLQNPDLDLTQALKHTKAKSQKVKHSLTVVMRELLVSPFDTGE